MDDYTAPVKLIDPFMQPGGRGKRGTLRARRFTVQIGSTGTDALEAVRAMVELGRRQKVGKRLGAEALIKAERR